MRRHGLDVVSLVGGLVFVVLALGVLLDVGGLVSVSGTALLPAALILAGAVGLLASRPRGD